MAECRFWGKEKDAIAAKQLGVSEDYTIFVMANQGEYFRDLDMISNDPDLFDGCVYADEVMAEVFSRRKEVKFPGKLQLVGMVPVGNADDDYTGEVYGIIDFSEVKE